MPPRRNLTDLERRIVDAIKRMRDDGMEPTSIYLTPEDRDELEGRDQAGGLPIRTLSGKGKSRIYDRHGRDRRVHQPRGLARKPLTAKPARKK